MTIDERLEALVGRHEALAQTVEIIASMQLVNEKAIQKLTDHIERVVTVVSGGKP